MINLLIKLFRGIKYEIKNIHIRYEDDFFGNPFSFGFTIRNIKLDTDTKQEEIEKKE